MMDAIAISPMALVLWGLLLALFASAIAGAFVRLRRPRGR